MLHFFKVTTFLWIILILHPSHNIIFLETVIIKFGGPRAEGREKQISKEINRLRKEINRLLGKVMSNIHLKVTIEEEN